MRLVALSSGDGIPIPTQFHHFLAASFADPHSFACRSDSARLCTVHGQTKPPSSISAALSRIGVRRLRTNECGFDDRRPTGSSQCGATLEILPRSRGSWARLKTKNGHQGKPHQLREFYRLHCYHQPSE